MHTTGPDIDQDLPYVTVCTMWYVAPPSPLRPYPKWTVPSTFQERRRGGDKEEDGDVGEEVRFGESEGGRQKGNSGGSGDVISGNKDNDEECRDSKGDADVYSFQGNIFEGYSHRDPENHQNNISASTRRSSLDRNWRPIYPTPGRS